MLERLMEYFDGKKVEIKILLEVVNGEVCYTIYKNGEYVNTVNRYAEAVDYLIALKEQGQDNAK